MESACDPSAISFRTELSSDSKALPSVRRPVISTTVMPGSTLRVLDSVINYLPLLNLRKYSAADPRTRRVPDGCAAANLAAAILVANSTAHLHFERLELRKMVRLMRRCNSDDAMSPTLMRCSSRSRSPICEAPPGLSRK